MDKTYIEADRLVPFNNIVDVDKVQFLSARMQSLGWQGLPIVAIDRADGLFAVNGSHRIEAALQAGITIPVVIINSDSLDYDWESLSDTDDICDMLRDNDQHVALEILTAESVNERASR